MAGRLWTALLMLAAVFAMHGLQCTSAGTPSSGATHTTSLVGPAEAAAVDGHVAGDPTAAMTMPQSGTGPMADGHPGANPVAAEQPAAVSDHGHGSTPHGSAGHLWTLCLAVLAAGIALPLALFAPRLVGPTAPAVRRTYARVGGWLAPLGPPDLSALCLLRI
jgi:hypothetical protein